MKEIPAVRTVMTPNPVTIDSEQPARVASKLMDDLSIRHLPVLHGHNIVGIVTDRDLKVAGEIEKRANIIVKVGDLCSYDVYTVSPNTPVDEVIENMERRAIGSTVVVDAGYVLGVFTTVDVCRVFKDFLRSAALRGPATESYQG